MSECKSGEFINLCLLSFWQAFGKFKQISWWKFKFLSSFEHKLLMSVLKWHFDLLDNNLIKTIHVNNWKKRFRKGGKNCSFCQPDFTLHHQSAQISLTSYLEKLDALKSWTRKSFTVFNFFYFPLRAFLCFAASMIS